MSTLVKDEVRETRMSASATPSRWRLVAVLLIVFVVGAGLAAGAAWWVTRTKHHTNSATLAAKAITAGVAAQGKGDLAGAARDYEKALGYEPHNTQALYDLGVVDFAQGNSGLADAQYRKVIAINATYEPALYNLAIIDQYRGNTTEALALYQRAVRAAPNDPRAHFNLALLLRTLPKYQADGDAQMKIALKLDPTLHDPAAKH
jgi:tetratricopeptide (TPR) repeat protein